MKNPESLTISRTTKSYPKLPYPDIKDAIIGKNYSLSLVFIGEQRAHRINQEYRQKNYIPDVLSFPLDASHGEIFICLQKTKREAAKYNHTYTEHVAFLFIHGLLHLKGHEHGATMEREEKKYCTRFNVC